MERGVMRGVTVEPEAAAPGARCLALGPLDRIYRALCAILYNYAPLSGHPGGSLSSGPLAQALVFRALDLDLSAPDRDDADRLVYAAGHKALGLYALWALRDEVARIGAPRLLPADPRQRLRLEDLLGFRRNPVNLGEPARSLGTRALDGHPTPATPFVPLATGASGVGLAASVGLALSLRDRYGPAAPRVHVLEGEGGLTPGRVAEALAAAATAGLDNLVLHVDWNQASIDSDRVCPEGDEPGDYVCWDPMDLARVHGWNVVPARDGADPAAIRVAQAAALGLQNGRPTAVVYRTVKGRGYGLEGRRSHGAGHALCSAGFRAAIAALGPGLADALPCCGARDCEGGSRREVLDRCAWDALRAVRGALEGERAAVAVLAAALEESRARLDARGRRPRDDAPDRDRLFAAAAAAPPAELLPVPGEKATLRAALGDALGHLGRAGRGAVLVAAADLLDSTSVGLAAEGFPGGFWRARDNPGSRRLSVGGICEDAMTGILSGLAAGGGHLGAGASYAAFLAPLGHVAGRLHAIGMAARRERLPGCPSDPIVLVCGHAGLETGEDGPTHADPQALQVLQGSFPPGACITLTPWEPREVWPLLFAALAARPAVIACYVTRPPVVVPDRVALGLPSEEEARTGVYRLRAARGDGHGVVVLQGSGVTLAFLRDALPRLVAEGLDLQVYHVSSAELFDALPAEEQERIFPAAHAARALGITGFTLPTLHRWVTSPAGRAASLHPFRRGTFPSSGPAADVLAQAGLDGEAQVDAVRNHVAFPRDFS